ncbi:MAG: glycosyltransferase family 4 protein [Gammaproteobacteria bacterium]
MTLRIAHLTTVHPWQDARIFSKMCCSLAAAGNEVHLIAVHGYPVGDEPVNGVHVHLFSEPMSRLARLTRSAWQVYRRALEVRADIYHFHDPELIGVGVLLRLHGRNVVYDVHEDMPKRILDREWVPKPLRKPLSGLISAVQAVGNRTLSGIVCATPTIAKRFDARKTVTVRNFPALEEFDFSDDSVTPRTPTIVFIGTIDVTRGVLELINGFRVLSERMDAKLVIAGRRRGDEYDRALDQAASGLPVEFPGWVDRQQVQSLLSDAAVGAVLSLPCDTANEAISTKLFEYMAGGIPVVTANMPLWAEVVESSQCGSAVEPSDSNAVAAVLEHWLRDADAARAAGDNGRDAIMNTYNWSKELPTLMQLYRRLAND